MHFFIVCFEMVYTTAYKGVCKVVHILEITITYETCIDCEKKVIPPNSRESNVV